MIDFGEAREDYLIYDIGELITYLISREVIYQSDKVLTIPQKIQSILEGYQEYVRLSEQELKSLGVVISATYLKSLVLCTHAKMQNPCDEYYTKTGLTWQVLRDIWGFKSYQFRGK